MSGTSAEPVTEAVRPLYASDAGHGPSGRLHADHVEHDPGLAPVDDRSDPPVGDRLTARTSRLRLVRMLSDGPLVVAQSEGRLGDDDSTFFDLFRVDEGAVAEHWGFVSPTGPPNRSGHTQADGPTTPDPEQDTGVSRALVTGYYQAFHLDGRDDVLPRYFRDDHCVRHEPGVADGVPAFRADVAVVSRTRSIDRIAHVVAENDFVFLLAEGTHQSEYAVYVDLYRVEGDAIREHWGFFQDFPDGPTGPRGVPIL